MIAKGVSGSITGKGGHVIIIDDPIKNSEEARSSTQKEKVWNFFQSTAFTRLAKDGAVIIVMTRWDKNDLVGKLINKMNSYKNTRNSEICGYLSQNFRHLLFSSLISAIFTPLPLPGLFYF